MRTRLTWKANRKASPGPATPGYNEPETLDHPAAYEDPGPHDYENGDTSSWAEDPTKGPYPNSAPPALPGTEEPQGHPATDPKHYFPRGVSASLVKAMEKKAAKCIRIASSMLGEGAPQIAIEDQAVDLMSLPDRQIQATLKRLAGDDEDAEEVSKDDLSTYAQAYGGRVMDSPYWTKQYGKKTYEIVFPSSGAAGDCADEMAAHYDVSQDGRNVIVKGFAESQRRAEQQRRLREAEEKEADDLMVEDDEKSSSKKAEDDSDEDDESDDEGETAGKKAARFQRLAAYWTRVAKAAGEVPEAFKKQWDKSEDKGEDEDKKEETKKEAKSRGRKASDMPGDQNDPKHYNYRQQGRLAEQADDEDEALLAAMLDEEAKSSSEDEDEALLAEMLDEGMKASDEDEALLAEMLKEDAPKAEPAKTETPKEDAKEAMLGDDEQAMLDDMLADDGVLDGVPVAEDVVIDEDPMGLVDDGLDAFDDMELNSLYGSKFAGDEEKKEDAEAKADVKEEKAEEKTPKEARSNKTAAVRPQPRKASNGVRAIGSVPTVSTDRDVENLSKLWESAPNISEIFK